jgi:hypothetical protein
VSLDNLYVPYTGDTRPRDWPWKVKTVTPHGLRDLSDKIMETARHHFYFNQAAEILHNMESHLCALAALHEQQHEQHAQQEERHVHTSTFQYMKPTDAQMEKMSVLRDAAAEYADVLEKELPDGPDKTFILRSHRTAAMWANVAITRNPDGSPRT